MKFDIEDQKTIKNREKRRQDRLLIIAFFFFLCLSIILMIVYFATKQPTKTTKTTNTQTTTKKETTKKEKIETVDEKSDYRPLAVIINGDTSVSKHAGLQDSYVNYEMISDNGQTKILAIYKDTEVGVIGPVTTLDHYFLDYALEHNAVTVSYGMTSYAEKTINSENYEYIGKEDSSAFMQDKESSKDNIFTSTTRMTKELETKKYKNTSSSWEVLKYSNEEVDLSNVSGSKKASYINLKYSTDETREYKYDSNNKYYLRFNNGIEDKDRKTNNQLHYKNVIVIYIKTDTLPKENLISIDTVGKGTAYYLTNGYMAEINWEKKSQTAKTKFTYKDGKNVELNDGNTFIQIVPDNE